MELGSVAQWTMVVITCLSVRVILLQLRADHERSRRELSVKLLQDWTKGLQFGTSTIMRLLRKLSQEQCDAIVSMEPVFIDKNDNLDLVKRIIDLKWPNFDVEKCVRDGKICIDGDYLVFLRFNVIYYLNLLESILSAWNSKVADDSILEEQFGFLKKNESDLAKFRKSMLEFNNGTNSYPSISNFMAKISPPVRPPARPLPFRIWPLKSRRN